MHGVRWKKMKAYEIFKKVTENTDFESEDFKLVEEERIFANGFKPDGSKNVLGWCQVCYALYGDGSADTAYVSSIEIDEQYRGQGLGTQVLKDMSAEFGGIYVCADNDRAAKLYERLGEEVPYDCIPGMYQGCADEYGTMWEI